MTTPKPRTFPIEMTLTEMVEVRDLIKAAYDEKRYYAEKEPAEGEELSRWEAESKAEAVAKRARYSRLHEVISGEPIPEA